MWTAFTEDIAIGILALVLMVISVINTNLRDERFLGFSAGVGVIYSLRPWKQSRILILQSLITLLSIFDDNIAYVYVGYPLIALMGFVLTLRHEETGVQR